MNADIPAEAGAARPPRLENISIVLSHTTEPRNIGAAARALKTMGLGDLRLINPEHPRGPHARAVAHGSLDVLEAASIHPDLETAVADCLVVSGTTNRRRELRKNSAMSPGELAKLLVEHSGSGKVAVVFGTERTGLTNEEVNHCRYLSTIDADESQPSLNLAQAVMVYSWEIRKAFLEATAGPARPGTIRPEMRVSHPHQSTKLPTQFELESMYAHLQTAMAAIGYSEHEQDKFLTYIRHMNMRAGIVDWETQVYHLLSKRILKATGKAPFNGRNE